MAGGFEVNPKPLNPEPVNGYDIALRKFPQSYYAIEFVNFS
jgi:hypothetical protein